MNSPVVASSSQRAPQDARVEGAGQAAIARADHEARAVRLTALQQGLARAAKTLRNVRGAWIKEQHVRWADSRVSEYQVNMMVTFVLDD